MAGNSIDDREIRDPDLHAAWQPLASGISAGNAVTIRGRRWRLDACVAHHDCHELHLHDTAGSKRVLLWPFDRPVATTARTRRVRLVSLPRWTRRLDNARARSLDARTPRATFSGEVLPYQLAPAAAIASGAARVLLADEVGLGKTIQAGWILADLLAREPEARVLVAVPASLREQWWTELNGFFTVPAACVDAAWLRAAVADRPSDVSPWAAPGVYLGSIDFLKRPDVARSLADVTWDLLVVDEAHAAAAPTERHAALVGIAAASRRIVVITATPYSGDAAGFASMMALGRLGMEAEPLMFRRSRDEVGDRRRRRHRFAVVRISRAGFRFQRLIERYTRDVWRHASTDADGARLAMTILRKRALSSPAAALRSLTRRLDLLSGVVPAPRQLSLFDDPPEPDDALPEAALAAPGLADTGLEQRWLGALIDAARRAVSTDSKERFLLRLLSRVRGEAIIVFTEYRDTLRRLAEVVPSALHLHGGLDAMERSEVQRRFNEDGGILLATDAAADGLNLQRRCRLLLNFELPWNPARLEQRIGRVDRIGQHRAVHAVSLVARDTAEDLVVAPLARRLARVAATLGERDRLASFLTDARTARSVIGGDPLAIADAERPALSFCRPLPDAYPIERMASEVMSRAATLDATSLAVAVVRARPPIERGYAVLTFVTAVTDRGVVARQPLLLHVPDALVSRPGSGREARGMAARAAAAAERAARSLSRTVEWFADVRAVHHTAVQARIAREEALHQGSTAGGEMQPGLFDRRLADLEPTVSAAERRGEERRTHLLALSASLDVRLEVYAAAVLIAWR